MGNFSFNDIKEIVMEIHNIMVEHQNLKNHVDGISKALVLMKKHFAYLAVLEQYPKDEIIKNRVEKLKQQIEDDIFRINPNYIQPIGYNCLDEFELYELAERNKTKTWRIRDKK